MLVQQCHRANSNIYAVDPILVQCYSANYDIYQTIQPYANIGPIWSSKCYAIIGMLLAKIAKNYQLCI